jgi:4-amino-4-deoxy-L-arabinose transferase-like glycosyltransferase
LALALMARLAYARQLPPLAPIESVDAQGYHALAQNLLAGRGFTLNSAPPFVPDAVRTPLYPMLVAAVYALVGPGPAAVAQLQALLDALTALVIVDVTRRLSGWRCWAWAAGLLYALNPTAWRFSNELLTEILLAAVLAWLLWAFVRYAHGRRARWLALAAVLSAIALLIKPNVVLLPALLALAVGLLPAGREGGRPRLQAALVVLALAVALAFPWLLRNRLVFGRWLFSHAFDNNLARVSAVATLVHAQRERVAPWTPRWEALYSGLLLEAEARYGDDFVGLPRTAREADRHQRQLAAVAAGVIRAHPRDFVLAHLGGFASSWVPQEHRFWYGRLAGRPWDSLGSEEAVFSQALQRLRGAGPGAALGFIWQSRFGALPPLALALWLGWLVAYAVSAALLARATWRWRRRPALLLLCWGTVLYATFLPGPIGDIRFRVPVAPLLVVLMALGLEHPPCPPPELARPVRAPRRVAAIPEA